MFGIKDRHIVVDSVENLLDIVVHIAKLYDAKFYIFLKFSLITSLLVVR